MIHEETAESRARWVAMETVRGGQILAIFKGSAIGIR